MMQATALLCAGLLALPFCLPQDPTEGPPRAVSSERGLVESSPLFERVFIVGASVSSGFLLQNDVGAPTSLADIVDAALIGDHEPIRSSTSLAFFLAPLARGGKQIDRALSHEPTLLLALDFLFWFGYGYADSEDDRLERLEQGLWLLDKVDVPIVVTDFPDMTPALDGRGPFGVPMLHPGQVPRTRTLERLNEKLRAWASERERVVLVPLSDFVARVHANELVEVRDNRWEESRSLLNRDLLHTSLKGSSALVVLAMDRLVWARPDLSSDSVRWDAAEIAQRAYDAKAPEREKAQELRRKREERKRKRERARAGG